MSATDDLKAIPSVDSAVARVEAAGAAATMPRPLVVRAVRAALERERRAILTGEGGGRADPAAKESILSRVVEHVRGVAARRLRGVVNATGIVVHTNLGRAPLSEDAVAALLDVARGYSNLEYDVVAGARGKRDLVVSDSVCELTGAEDALVVNNNAAAVMLALNTLASGREVVVSRSELIEIGGAFRLPDVFERSGARMVEVGTTNRTRLADYESAIRSSTGALMSAHWSNYRISGFVERVPLEELAALGGRYGIPVIHDLGSGILLPPGELGLEGEMTVQESVAAGATVSTFSGDKILGGPQAGIAVGRRDAIERMRANPLTRALRPGKLTLAALQATLFSYLDGTAREKVPVLALIAEAREELDARARALAGRLEEPLRGRADVSVVELEGLVGGGAAPERSIASAGVAVTPQDGKSAGSLAAAMLSSDPPVVVITRDNRLLMDMRTVRPQESEAVALAVLRAFGEG